MTLTALIDCDVLRYECSAVGEKIDKTTGERNIQSFDFVKQVFDERITTILSGCGADNYKLFLSGDSHSTRIINRMRKRDELSPIVHEANFREALAKGKVYKGTRKQDKPFHWLNLTAYILGGYSSKVHVTNGYEADDLIGIEGYNNPSAIICTRDKDLRMVPGWHYGWECGKQPEFGPIEYDSVGELQLIPSKPPKLKGGGFAFFASQLLTGDVVDNIGGLPGYGPVKAYNILRECSSEREYFSAVVASYKECYGDEEYRKFLREQCSLLWIVRERHPDGSLKHFDLEQWLQVTQNIKSEDLS